MRWEKLDNLIDDVIRLSVTSALVDFANFNRNKATKCAAIMAIRRQKFYDPMRNVMNSEHCDEED
jgi:hypothetical protein